MSQTNGHTQSCGCDECNLLQLARNNYFTGKLMVERDFTDEQRYFRGKLQRHNHNLHGTGVVCGLKVIQHPNESCRSTYVIVEPGTAIDCCGHEIIVPDELQGQVINNQELHGVLFKFADAPAMKNLVATTPPSGGIDPVPAPIHSLQFCVRFKECLSENIPVLYDECGCDETRCAPNRILESYQLDVMVDQPPSSCGCSRCSAGGGGKVKLEWKNTILLANSKEVALDENGQRLYVLSLGDPGLVRVVSTQDYNYVTTSSELSLTTPIFALALSNDGSLVYVALPATANAAATVSVFSANNLTGPVLATLQSAATTDGYLLKLAVTPDDRLVGLYSSGTVAVWNFPVAIPTASAKLPASLVDIVFSSDAKSAYGADNTGSNVPALDLTSATLPSSQIAVDPTAVPKALAFFRVASGDILAVGDNKNSKLYLVSLGGANPVASVALTNPPIGLVASLDGNWVYVLEMDNMGKCSIEPVNVGRVQNNQSNALGTPLNVGLYSTGQMILSKSGKTLYIPYIGHSLKPILIASIPPATGGVAIVDISQTNCADLLQQDCCSCSTPDCVVLATVNPYHLNDEVSDPADPPPNPPYNPASPVAKIDNSARCLLPSTQVLTEVIECILEHGLDGKNGTNGTNGTNGKDGQGLEAGLTQISALSWAHADVNTGFSLVPVTLKDGSKHPGIVIGFSNQIDFKASGLGLLDGAHIMQVMARLNEFKGKFVTQLMSDLQGAVMRCSIPGLVIPVQNSAPGNPAFPSGQFIGSPVEIDTALDPQLYAYGIAFLVDAAFYKNMIQTGIINELWVTLRGDFVIDINGKAVDAEFVRASLPTGDRPQGQTLGIQGGLFESWFWLRPYLQTPIG